MNSMLAYIMYYLCHLVELAQLYGSPGVTTRLRATREDPGIPMLRQAMRRGTEKASESCASTHKGPWIPPFDALDNHLRPDRSDTPSSLSGIHSARATVPIAATATTTSLRALPAAAGPPLTSTASSREHRGHLVSVPLFLSVGLSCSCDSKAGRATLDRAGPRERADSKQPWRRASPCRGCCCPRSRCPRKSTGWPSK